MFVYTAVIVVNWNGWQDTVRCVDAALNMDGFCGAIFVCDNASSNQSFTHMLAWANGLTAVSKDATFPDVVQTCDIRKVRHHKAGSTQSLEAEIKSYGVLAKTIYFIQAERNGGFSYGNNLAIKLAMLGCDVDVFWMLNSDALPSNSAYLALKQHCYQKTYPILSGSVLCEYWHPNTIQSIGFMPKPYPWSCFKSTYGKNIFAGFERRLMVGNNVKKVLYPVGASMLVNRAYIEHHGLLDERLFLFHEEPDLAFRCQPENVYVCTQSIVYHKGGASTGQSYQVKKINAFVDFHMIRSRWILAKKFGSIELLATFLLTTSSLFKRIITGQFKMAFNVLKASYNALLNSK